MSKVGRANILITATQVPFTRGGAEVLVDKLKEELVARDFLADVVQLPFNAQPKSTLLNSIALWRSLDLRVFNGRKVDLVIGTKFPSYMVSHPNKVLWLIHQHRQIYDLYGSRFGDFHPNPKDEALREMIVRADAKAIEECVGSYTISPNVSERLRRYLGIDSTPLLPPLPLGSRYRSGSREPYILSVGRLCSIKRVDLIIKSLPLIDPGVSLKIVGTPDEPAIDTYLKSEIDKHHLWDRVSFLGRVSDEELLQLYADCLAVYYAPFDEDYGFVTLEGLASGKPIVTAHDSGGVLEFVRHEENGLISEPNEAAIAQSVNRLFQDEALYERLTKQCAEVALTSWDEVVEELTQSLENTEEEDQVPTRVAAGS